MATPSQPVFLGLDVSSEQLDLGVWPSGSTSSFPYNDQGLAALLAALSKLQPTLIVIEASGGYQRRVVAELLLANFPVSVVNPRQVRDFARGLGQLAKTDAVDALILARFGELVQPRLLVPSTQEAQLLQELVTRKQQLSGMRTAELNRLQQAISPQARRSIRKVIKLLDRELADLDEAACALVENDAHWKQLDAILQSVPGIGGGTSTALIALLPELGLLNRQQIAALAGLAPYAHESGKFKGQRSIWGGRACVRTALYMATLSARRCNSVIKAFAERLTAQHKPFKLVHTACMRKLLTLLNSLVKNNTPWNPKCALKSA